MIGQTPVGPIASSHRSARAGWGWWRTPSLVPPDAIAIAGQLHLPCHKGRHDGSSPLRQDPATGPSQAPLPASTARVSAWADFPPGTVVTLTAAPDAGSSFDGWSDGDCVDGQVTLNSDLTCAATFKLPPMTETFERTISGSTPPCSPFSPLGSCIIFSRTTGAGLFRVEVTCSDVSAKMALTMVDAGSSESIDQFCCNLNRTGFLGDRIR